MSGFFHAYKITEDFKGQGKEDMDRNQGLSSVRPEREGKTSPAEGGKGRDMGIVSSALLGFGRRGDRWEAVRKSYWLGWKRGREGNQHFLEAKIVKNRPGTELGISCMCQGPRYLLGHTSLV